MYIQLSRLTAVASSDSSPTSYSGILGLLRFVASSCALAISVTAHAQEKQAPSQAPSEVVTLSPFVVKSSGDIGYLAGNTLAGSRLNTDIKDTPASIDVFTPELLADLGATSLPEALAYANNVEIDQGDTERTVTGDSTVSASSPTRFRSRGFLGTLARDYFETDLTLDFYVADRLDESRGPNSILFGIGSPGGLVNSTTKRPMLQHSAVETEVKVGNQDYFRTTIDINQVILPDQLGVRFNAVHDYKGSWRDYLYSRTNGANLALGWQPSRSTTIRAQYEQGSLRGTTAQNFSLKDQSNVWWLNGRPSTVDVATNAANPVNATAPTTAQIAKGLDRFGTDRYTFVENQGTIYNAKNEWTTYGSVAGAFTNGFPTAASPIAKGAFVGLVDDSGRYPQNADPVGPGGRRLHDYHVWEFNVEHVFNEHFSGEVAYYHEDGDWTSYDIQTNNTGLRGDPNTYFRTATVSAAQIYPLSGYVYQNDSTGTLNPNVGKLYIETNWRKRAQTIDSDTVRATLAATFNLGWLGEHRLAGLTQRLWKDNTAADRVEAVLGAPYGTSPTGSTNLLWRRYYVTPGDSSSYRAPDWADLPSISFVQGGIARSTGFINVPNSLEETHRTVDSFMIADQAFFWKRRLVATAGYRIDRLKQDRVNESVDKSGIWAGTDGIAKLNYDDVSHFSYEGRTMTLGLTAHLLPWLSLIGNKSENIGLPNFNGRIGSDAESPPAPKGSGKEAGIQLNLLDGRIFGRIVYFDTAQTNTFNSMGVDNAFTPSYNGIMGAIQSADGKPTAALAPYLTAERIADIMAQFPALRRRINANGDTIDTSAKGLETHFVFNLTKNFRFLANYSYTDQQKIAPYPRITELFNQLNQFLGAINTAAPAAGVQSLATTNPSPPFGIATIGEELAYRRDDIIDRGLDFEQASGSRKHKISATGAYSFSGRRLKGWTIGGGVRYQSAPVIGYDDVDTSPTYKQVYYGDDSFLVDAMLRYNTRIKIAGARREISFQLNVRNLLDETDIQATRTLVGGNPNSIIRWNYQEPRTFVFSTTLKL